MDLSFPGQRTATATLCIPHDSVYMPGPHTGKSENGFFRCDTWLQNLIFQNDSKICKVEVKVTPLINKICKPWTVSIRMTNLRATMCSFYPPLSKFSVLWVLKPLQAHRQGKKSKIRFMITPRAQNDFWSSLWTRWPAKFILVRSHAVSSQSNL